MPSADLGFRISFSAGHEISGDISARYDFRYDIQQAIITELTFSRSCLQDWFSTGLLVGNDFMAGLRAGRDFRADLTTMYVYRYGLSACHDLVLTLELSVTLRKDIPSA